jgi:hypothetical protein
MVGAMTPVEMGGLLVLILNLLAVGTAIYKLGRAVERFEGIGVQQANEIGELKKAVSGMGELITKMAVSSERLDGLMTRMNRQEVRLDELAHGEGFVLPLGGVPR